MLDQQPPLFAGRNRKTDRLQKGIRGEVQLRPLRQNIGRQIFYTVIKARNGNVAVLVKEAPEDAGQYPDWVLRAAAKDPGVQIAVGGLDLHLLVDKSAQRGGDRGRIRVPHPGVANQCVIGFELVLVLLEKRHEVLRSDFFFAFDDDGKVKR